MTGVAADTSALEREASEYEEQIDRAVAADSDIEEMVTRIEEQQRRRVEVESGPEDLERVERTVAEVGEAILAQDFEPTPSPSTCAWCDFRTVCPAAEA